MSDENKKNDTVMFSCDRELKEQYYEICKQNEVNPHSLLRGFMRRAVRDWKDKKITSNEKGKPEDEQNE